MDPLDVLYCPLFDSLFEQWFLDASGEKLSPFISEMKNICLEKMFSNGHFDI